MSIWNQYPYTDFHELNLDWIIKMIKEVTKEMNDFKVVNRIVWGGLHDPGKEYPRFCIVDTPTHEGYISIQPVPAGITINNEDYWRQVANYSALYADFQNRIIAIENRIDTLVATHRHILYVTPGTTSAETFTFSTIGDAVTYARTFCTKTNRVLIIIAPGTYNESIHLHPNPGIDMIGYGATIKNDTKDYPDAALFTTDLGYFEGITFKSTTATYGCHVEKKDITTTYGGDLKFINCTFIATGNNKAGFGCGLTSGQSLWLDGCTFIADGTTNTQGALFLHNAQSENQGAMIAQNLYINNCRFFSDSWDAVFTDACEYFNFHESSIMHMFVTNCVGETKKVRFNTTYGRAQDHYLIDTNNIKIDLMANNNMPAFMKEFPFALRGYFGNTSSDSGSIFVKCPIEASSIEVKEIITKNNVDGSRRVAVSSIVSQDDYLIGIVNAVNTGDCYGSYNLTCEPI